MTMPARMPAATQVPDSAPSLPMTDAHWRRFFTCCTQVLGGPQGREGWMAWTTYQRLLDDAGYWTGGFPAQLEDSRFRVDSPSTRGEFFYGELAHVIVPRRYRLRGLGGGYAEQDLQCLSDALGALHIGHDCSGVSLQIRCL